MFVNVSFAVLLLILGFLAYSFIWWMAKDERKFDGGRFFFLSLFATVLGLVSILVQYETNLEKRKAQGNAQAKCFEMERDYLFDFIKSTREYGDRMTEFASLTPGDLVFLVFDLDDRAYIVTRVAEEATEPYVECRDLALSGDMTILIEKKDGWKYEVMKKEDGLYTGTIMDILAPASVPEYE